MQKSMNKKKSRKNSKKPLISFGKLEMLEESPKLNSSEKQKESFLKERLSKISEKSFEKFLNNEVLSPIQSLGKNHIHDLLRKNEKNNYFLSNNSLEIKKRKLQLSNKAKPNNISRNFLKQSFQKKINLKNLNQKSKLSKRAERKHLQTNSNFTSLEENAFKKNKKMLNSYKRIQIGQIKAKENKKSQIPSREEKSGQPTKRKQSKSTKKKMLNKLKTDRPKQAKMAKSPTFAQQIDLCSDLQRNALPFLTMGYGNQPKSKSRKKRKSSMRSLERSGAAENHLYSSFQNSDELRNNSMLRFSYSNEKVFNATEKLFTEFNYFEEPFCAKKTGKKMKSRENSNPVKKQKRDEDSYLLEKSGRQHSDVFSKLPKPKKTPKFKMKARSNKKNGSFRHKALSQLVISKYKNNLIKYKLKKL